jgi:hypothetical protein
MTTRENDDDCRLGFLAAIEVPERGYIGGLLVTNRFGRPLEFQCTTPVKPNRTQEILYGPTLVPFVLGELIGRTLLDKVGVKPHFVLTEAPEILEVRNHVGLPVACIEAGAATSAEPNLDASSDVAEFGNAIGQSEPHDGPEQTSNSLKAIDAVANKRRRSGRILRFHASHESDRREIEERIAALPKEIDLREPFERVREALDETTRVATVK